MFPNETYLYTPLYAFHIAHTLLTSDETLKHCPQVTVSALVDVYRYGKCAGHGKGNASSVAQNSLAKIVCIKKKHILKAFKKDCINTLV